MALILTGIPLIRGASTRTRRRSTGSEFLASEKKINELRVATAVDRNRAGRGNLSVDNQDMPTHGLRSPSRESTSDFSDSEFSSPVSFRSMDLHAERFDFSGVESDSPRHSSMTQSSVSRVDCREGFGLVFLPFSVVD